MVGRGDVFKNRAFERITERLPLENQAPPPVVEVEPETEEAELTFYRDLAQPSPEPKRALEGPLTVVDPPKPPVPDIGRRTGPAAESTGESLEKEPEPAAPETESAAGSEAEPSTPTKRPQSTSGVKTVEPDQSAQPPPKIQPGQNYTVQVAASSDADDAGRVVDKLKAQGFDDAYYYQVELNGRRYFRVRVGRYATRAEAEKTMNRLAEAGRSNMFISALTQ
jgi:DedD protein